MAEPEMMSEEEMMPEKVDDEEDLSYKAESVDDEEDMDETKEKKAADSIVYGHNATGQKMGESNLTGRFDSEFSEFIARKSATLDTLDLSEENVAKAYAQFKAEQEEARAYDLIKNEFEARYNAELKMEADMIAKENYDASAEVAALKNEFAQLRKSLESNNEVIAKQVTQAPSRLSDDVISKMDNIGEMSWEEINDLVNEVQG